MTYKYCKMNIALNGLSNVDLFQYGLWNENTTLNIKIDEHDLGGSSIAPAEDVFDMESIQCETLDNMLNRRVLACQPPFKQ